MVYTIYEEPTSVFVSLSAHDLKQLYADMDLVYAEDANGTMVEGPDVAQFIQALTSGDPRAGAS